MASSQAGRYLPANRTQPTRPGHVGRQRTAGVSIRPAARGVPGHTVVAMQRLDDILATPILGPWVKPPAAMVRRQHVYLSLVHWYEAAKFMPHRPDMREQLLFSPTSKEARKFARMRKDAWRTDWPVTRHSALIAGLGMLALQRPEAGLIGRDLAEIKAGLAPMELPERFVDACLERFDLWRQAPRISVFGADNAPSDVVGVKLAKLVSPMPTWTLVSPFHCRTAWRVHDWALSHYVPVLYVGGGAARTSRSLATKIIAASDQVIVFEQRKQRRHDFVIQSAKLQKRKLTLELFDLEGAPAAQMRLT